MKDRHDEDKTVQMDSATDYASLQAENERLRLEIARLQSLLDSNGIPYLQTTAANPVENKYITDNNSQVDETIVCSHVITKKSPHHEKVKLFLSCFHGRDDVYARRWQSKDGKIGYSPACKREWQRGICGKPKQKCAACPNAEYYPYDATAIETHLRGQCVLGVYPLRKDDTCAFLAIDFDEEDWKTDVKTVAKTCEEWNVPHAVEISRSGNGVHLWMFFDEYIPASKARGFGSLLLSETMQKHARLNFASYDRMFPNQDTMPKGGFGNLIALPFQVSAYRNGGSVFVDEGFRPYEDQWVFLSSLGKITEAALDELIRQKHGQPLGELRVDTEEENSKPWQREEKKLCASDMPETLNITIADRVYVPVAGLSNRVQNRIKRLAAFRNPQFYLAQAMRMPVWNIPRVICCAEYQNEYLCLPRGCLEDLTAMIDGRCITLCINDEREAGRKIAVSFSGELRDEQNPALASLLAHDDGILSATTAFGKTVIGAALIAHRQVNTLILVHRKQLLEQWRERLETFLRIDETLPPEPKRRGRKKKRELIGMFGAGRDTRSGIVDIAILQSMGVADEIKEWIGDYGMVIVDECHHVPATSFEQVLKAVRAKYVYGLTATPTRKDGHHPILNMYLGGIRYQVDAKAQAEKRPFSHVMVPRFTGASFVLHQEDKSQSISHYYSQITHDDLRNHMIVDDVLACVKEGRNCLLLSERKEHVHALAALLEQQVPDVLTMTGGKTNAETAMQMRRLKDAPTDRPLILCATGKYIGEGFDEARLDTLFLTMPISWKGTLAQYAGRLHRLYDGKREVRVYDYIDNNVEMLERMYQRRLKGYASIGYQVRLNGSTVGLDGNIIYDQLSFQPHFLQDLEQARQSIKIVSPYVTMKRVRWLETLISEARQRRVEVTVITRPADSFDGRSKDMVNASIALLRDMGVQVMCQSAIHQKYAIVDEKTVWYGSINLLSFGASEESIMRLVSGSVARALVGKENA